MADKPVDRGRNQQDGQPAGPSAEQLRLMKHNLNTIRIQKKISIQQVAKLSGFSRAAMDRLMDENNETWPRMDTVLAACHALGIPFDALMRENEDGYYTGTVEQIADMVSSIRTPGIQEHIKNEVAFFLQEDLRASRANREKARSVRMNAGTKPASDR